MQADDLKQKARTPEPVYGLYVFKDRRIHAPYPEEVHVVVTGQVFWLTRHPQGRLPKCTLSDMLTRSRRSQRRDRGGITPHFPFKPSHEGTL